MWPSIDRTRRRILRTDADGQALPDALDAWLSIGRPELDRLCGAIQALLGPATPRPDTPDRLEAGLADAIVRIGGGGRVEVSRRPAGLYTPESWQVHLIGSDPGTDHAIREAVRTGTFAP